MTINSFEVNLINTGNDVSLNFKKSYINVNK